ncbi:MAG: amino acid transporter, partial [Halobacteria archaeon]|nr:amino acid transporter [Halobacteria archaeon]
GIVYATTLSPTNVTWGLSRLTSFGPVMAASISFVAFQGWQLLFYDQDSISDPLDTVPRAVYISIPVAVGIYVLVAAVTVNLAPQAIQNHPHVALADAASQMLSYFGLGGVGFAVISLSALFSTGSAINATLFSSGHFAKGMVSDGLLPDRIKKSKSEGVPTRTVLVIGGITAVFTAYGSLGGITSFASLAFIIVFGAMSYLAFRNRDHGKIHPLPPLVGTVGTALFFPLMFYNLYTREPNTFWTVIVVTVVVIAVEILYFEREEIEEGVIAVEEEIVAELENE